MGALPARRYDWLAMTISFSRVIRPLYIWAYDRLYHELAWGYDLVSWFVSLGRWDSWRRAALRFVRGERVLEVGFGTGELLPLLAVKAERAVGLEASAAMHRVTTRKLTRRHVKVLRAQGTAQRLPFADTSIDSIVCTFPAGFILDPAAHVEFARVLRPGGRLIVVDVRLNSANPFFRLLFQLVFPPVKEAGERYHRASAATTLIPTVHLLGDGPVQTVVTVSEKGG
jgi:ubiquinone/menaquinone biosynthesis C-methylase UbiE